MTYWITAYPTGPQGHIRASALVTLRDTLRALYDQPEMALADILAAVEAGPLVMSFDDAERLSVAVEALRAAGFTITDERPEPAPDEPAAEDYDGYSLASVQVALVALQVTNGNPVAALGHIANLARIADPDDDTFMDAGRLLIETFNAHEQMDLMRQMGATS